VRTRAPFETSLASDPTRRSVRNVRKARNEDINTHRRPPPPLGHGQYGVPLGLAAGKPTGWQERNTPPGLARRSPRDVIFVRKLARPSIMRYFAARTTPSCQSRRRAVDIQCGSRYDFASLSRQHRISLLQRACYAPIISSIRELTLARMPAPFSYSPFRMEFISMTRFFQSWLAAVVKRRVNKCR
jgi:hypothetical protein